MNTLDLLKCGAAIGIEVAALYAIAKLATRFTASPHWQRTIWQAAFVAMLIAFAGEVNGVRGMLAPAPLPLPEPMLPVVSSVVTVAPVEFDSFAPLPAPEPMIEVQDLPATLAAPEPQISTPDVLRWCWITGAAVLLLRMFVALLFTTVFRVAAERVTNPGLLECVERLRALLRVRRHVGLCQTGRVAAPFTFGVVRPVIVLPRRFSTAFNSEQQQLALLHELAHIAAFDAVWRVLANILCVLLWWHPLVWMARRELAHASEAAADEASLTIENGPAHLADCLLQCARQLKPYQRHLWIGMGGFRSSIGKRIERLLSLTVPSRPVVRPVTWVFRLAVPLFIVSAIWGLVTFVVPSRNMAWSESLLGSVWTSTARAAQPQLQKKPASTTAVPNAAATSSASAPIIMSPQREKTYEKLRTIRLPELRFDSLPLAEVIKSLSEAVRKQDTENSGINIMISAPAETSNSINSVTIRVSEPLRNITVEEALNVIAMVADRKIKWQVEDFGVVLSPRPPEAIPLHTRFFKVNVALLVEALQKRFGTNDPLDIPKNAPLIDAPSAQPSIEKPNTGIILLTRATATTIIPLIKKHFSSIGVHLDEEGKAVFYNDRIGYLMVRATWDELDKIEAAMRPFRATEDVPPGGGSASTAEEVRVNSAALVQSAKQAYEAGELGKAHAYLERALQSDPENKATRYYLTLVEG